MQFQNMSSIFNSDASKWSKINDNNPSKKNSAVTSSPKIKCNEGLKSPFIGSSSPPSVYQRPKSLQIVPCRLPKLLLPENAHDYTQYPRKSNPVYTGCNIKIESVVSEIFSGQYLELCDEDWDLFQNLPEVEKYNRERTNITNIHEFFKIFGIGIEYGDQKLPEFDCIKSSKFKFGPKKRTVIIAENISQSPFGISLLSWILKPCSENAAFLAEIMKQGSEHFSNCFMDEISEKRTNGRPHSCLVVPLGWPYWFGLSNSFTRDHKVKLGDLGILIGMPNKIKKVMEGINRRIGSRNKSNESVETALQCKDRTGEMLTQDENGYLLYIPNIRQTSVLSEVQVNLSFPGDVELVLKTKFKPSDRGHRVNRLIFEGFIVPFLSYDHFLKKRLRSKIEGGIIGRNEWLSRFLQHKTIFPRGENNGFLRAVTSEEMHFYPAKDIFENEDLCVSCSTLLYREVKEKLNFPNLKVLIPEGEVSYLLTCSRNSVPTSSQYTGDTYIPDRCSSPVRDEESSGTTPHQKPLIQKTQFRVEHLRKLETNETQEGYMPIENDLG